MKKKIIIHSIAFSPDGVSTAYIYNDIAQKFSENNFDVIVLTTTPHYNIVPEEICRQPLISRFWGLYYESTYKNIRVIHVPQRKFKSTLLRMGGFIYWHFLSLLLGLMQMNISLIISPSPPLTIGLISIVLGKIKGAKVIYNVQEIYPDFLINQGLLKFSGFISIFKKLEKYVYNNSDAVTTIDSVFYDTIVKRFDDITKLSIIPNFVDTDIFKPITKEQLTLNLSKFPNNNGSLKLMYAGNIGHAQAWEPLLEIAKQVKNLPVEFWVIGEGVMRNYLKNCIENNNLTNVHLIGYQPRDKMSSTIAFADIHFIFMTPEMEGQGFPSKVYSIMACSKPLLIISGKNTPLHNFLNNTNAAFIINSKKSNEKIEQAIEVIQLALENPQMLTTMGMKGLEIIKKNYSKEVITQKYLNLVSSLI